MRFSTYAVLFLSLFAATFAQAQADRPAEREMLRLLQEKMLAANAHDTDRFLALFVHDETLVFVINGQVIRGFDSLHELQLKWWNQGKSDVVYSEQAPPEFLWLDRKTVLVTEQLASRRTSPDGRPSEGKFAVTGVWRHSREGWRVIYAHESSMR